MQTNNNQNPLWEHCRVRTKVLETGKALREAQDKEAELLTLDSKADKALKDARAEEAKLLSKDPDGTTEAYQKATKRVQALKAEKARTTADVKAIQQHVGALAQGVKQLEPLWKKAFRLRNRLQGVKDTDDKADEQRALDLKSLKESYQMADQPLHHLIRAGFILFHNPTTFVDITQVDKQNTKAPKDANSLIADFKTQIDGIRDDLAIAIELWQQLEGITDEEAFDALKQENENVVLDLAYLLENVYASPTILRKEQERADKTKNRLESNGKIPAKAKGVLELSIEFFQKSSLETLKKLVESKISAMKIALADPYVAAFEQAITRPYDPLELKDSILCFRWRFLREGEAMVKDFDRLKEKALLRQNINDAAENANIISSDAAGKLFDILRNGTFEPQKNTFVDSVMATLNQYSKHTIVDMQREQRDARTESSGNLTTLPSVRRQVQTNLEDDSGKYRFKDVPIDDFTNKHATLLTSWRDKLSDSLNEKGMNAFLNYAYSISPKEKDTPEEKNYLEKQSHLNDVGYNTYQGQVRDGGYKAVNLFNSLFFNRKTNSGLAFIGKKNQKSNVLISVAREDGEPILLSFPDEFRSDQQVKASLSEKDLILYCVLETIQAQEHILVDILNE
ncbi:hypothetical protein GCM10028805_37780 [Spirosoma harenae]